MLSPLEKVILESLYSSKNPKSINDIHNDTLLPKVKILKIILTLKSKNFIQEENSLFSVNLLLNESIRALLRKKETKLFDLKLILDKVQSFFYTEKPNSSLTLHKVHLTNDEYNTVESLMKQVDLYIKERKNNTRKSTPLHQKYVLYWGKQSYKELYSQSL